jgi:hypothetical protein
MRIYREAKADSLWYERPAWLMMLRDLWHRTRWFWPVIWI